LLKQSTRGLSQIFLDKKEESKGKGVGVGASSSLSSGSFASNSI